MPKTNLSDILVHGDDFTIRSLKDIKHEDVKRFEQVRLRQQESESRKYPNWDKLKSFRIFPGQIKNYRQ